MATDAFIEALKALAKDWEGRRFYYPGDYRGEVVDARNEGKEEAFDDAADELKDLLRKHGLNVD